MNDYKISDNFSLSEFNYVKPEDSLLMLLQGIRDVVEEEVRIIDSTRTVYEHIAIYNEKYGEDWFNYIPWGSRHLSTFRKDLEASDIRAVKTRDYKGNPETWWRGDMLAEIAKKEAKKLGINIGTGVGQIMLHVDLRDKDTEWHY